MGAPVKAIRRMVGLLHLKHAFNEPACRQAGPRWRRFLFLSPNGTTADHEYLSVENNSLPPCRQIIPSTASVQ
jgi:hypothetical protein